MSFWKKNDEKSDEPESVLNKQPGFNQQPGVNKQPVVNKLDPNITKSAPHIGVTPAERAPLRTNPQVGPVPPSPSTMQPASCSSDDRSDETGIGASNSLHEKYGKLRSALGAGTVIQGKLSFDTPVRIDGKLSGEVFSSKVLIIGASGVVDAQVEVASLVVMGRVKGNVKASEKIELLPGGVIDGDVSSPSFMMESGAVFNGNLSMAGAATSAVAKSSEEADSDDKQDKKKSSKTDHMPQKKDTTIVESEIALN